jgi:hypothetical protein
MKEEIKYIIVFIISIILSGITLTIYIIDTKLNYLFLIITTMIIFIGRIVYYIIEGNDNK